MKSYELYVCEPAEFGDADAEVKLVTFEGVPAETAGTRSVVAHAALWWRDTPVMDGVNIGAIGDFDANDSEETAILLEGATDFLREQGCRIAVGPMNGNTWRPYRFVVESDGRGPFLLEPRNPVEFPGWWENAGFSVLSRYSSSVIPLDGSATISSALKARMTRSGVKIRELDPARYDEELKKTLSGKSEEFLEQFSLHTAGGGGLFGRLSKSP